MAVEAELKLAGLVLNQFVDDCALPRTGGLKERDLALRFEGFALNQFLFSLTVPNFNSIAMAPLGSIAGTAASFIGSYTTLLGALLGLVIGRSFNGTVIPLSLGYLGLGAACLGGILWTEKGRLSLRDRMDEGKEERALPVAAE